MVESNLQKLVKGYFNKTLSEQQRQELFAQIRNEAHEQEIKRLLYLLVEEQDQLPEKLPEEISMDILQNIFHAKTTGITDSRPSHPVVRYRWWYAAAAILLVTISVIWLLQPHRYSTSQSGITDITTGKYGAILTLFNGKQVILDSLSDGLIAEQDSVRIFLKQGQLVIDAQNLSNNNNNLQNTLSTPSGQQFSLLLPDSSRIWLNAASSVSFPVTFNSITRDVRLTGEAYFEVKSMTNKPFIVTTTNGMQVQVLGTGFNINAYPNEPVVTTTLVNGSVKLRNNNTAVLLMPGEQAIYKTSTTHQFTLLKNVDITAATAWKDGLFAMKDLDIQALARQIARWYNIEVDVKNSAAFQSVSLGGSVRRDVPLPDLMMALENYGIQSKLENKKLLIYPEKSEN
jgi:ferric-dicitrate binding protein FerR (iron transport regulator)